MLKQGKFMIIIGTMVLVIAGGFSPFNLWQKLFFSIGMINIGMLAYGSSVLFNRLAKKITNRGE
ncbi:hypothetical protein [Bacillus paranthracis]|uniref:hypothetical protein n=1 Tax=Bacillus paranthracis TaxID=2026186 RepID=UPI0021D12849|nr:hypothetical protein [Bacillus paranthracis]MCU5470939.1 hypothetical protein [Bacillus paranthracis]